MTSFYNSDDFGLYAYEKAFIFKAIDAFVGAKPLAAALDMSPVAVTHASLFRNIRPFTLAPSSAFHDQNDPRRRR